ncbi:MAG: DUF4347 domain-containing protein [Sulfuritalea sp.]|nr:DUF4347 domain-containing protein [Sulfuritalea sp.]
MTRTALSTALTTLAASIAKAFRPSGRLQAPARRKALFEAMEQRFLLSVEGVVPPPPPAPTLPALEAPLDTDAAVQSVKLSAASTPVQYTLQGGDQAGDPDQAAATLSAASDPAGVAATTPVIVAIDPTLPNAGSELDTAGKAVVSATPVGAPAASENPEQAGSKTNQAGSELAPAVLADVSAGTIGTPVQISLAAYTAFVQSRPAPAQVIIVDPAVTNYEELVKSIVSYGAAETAATVSPAGDDSASDSATKPATVSPLPNPSGSPAVSVAVEPTSSGPMLRVSRYGDVEVVVLDAGHDGIDQVTDILSSYHGLAAVQVLSHGGSGSLRLGASQVTGDKLDQARERVTSWGRALRPGGDIMLYGCDVARGTAGLDFVQNLASLTGADVAASTNVTGNAALGGDWQLEYSTGIIEAQPWFNAEALAGYTGVLDNLTGTIFNDTLTATYADETLIGLDLNDTYKFIDDWGDDLVTETTTGGFDTLDFSDVAADLTFTLRQDGSIRVVDGANPLNVVEATHVENLIGGSGANRFVFEAGSVLLGSIVGSSGGSATLDYSTYVAPISFNLDTGATTGILGALAGGVTKVNSIIGTAFGVGTDTITGKALDSRWEITAAGAGKINTIYSFTGFEALVAGSGVNTLDYSGYASGISVNLDAGTATGFASATGFRNVTGTVFADALTGTTGDNVFSGGAGNDIVSGNGGIDTIVESRDANFTLTDVTLTIGSEVDSLSGISWATLTGGAGNNTITATTFSGSVTLSGGAGDDILTGTAQGDVLIGGAGNDLVSGGAGNDSLTGGEGIDNLDGGTGTNTLIETGNSRFVLTNSTLDMGEGTNEVQTVTLGAGVTGGTFSLVYDGETTDPIAFNASPEALKTALTTLTTIGDDDVLVTSAAAELTGTVAYLTPRAIAAGTLSIDIGEGAIALDVLAGTYDAGGGTTDIANVVNRLIALNAQLAGKVEVATDAGGHLVFTTGATGPGATLSVGGTNAAAMFGNAAVAKGGPWVVSFRGNLAGKDVSQMTVTSNLTGGTATVSTTTAGVVEANTLANIQVAKLTGGASDNLINTTGFTAGHVVLDGGMGADTLFGGIGNDSLFGGQGDDLLTGVAGNDTIDGGQDIDSIIESADANMTLTNISLTIGAEANVLSGVERATLTGGDGANTIDAGGFSGGLAPDGPLAYLNNGTGVRVQSEVGKKDLYITLRDGSTVDVELKYLRTLQEVFDAIHAANANLTAGLNAARTAIVITDATAGAGNLTVSALAGSTAAADLGILGVGAGGTVTGTGLVMGGVTLDGGGGADILTGTAGNDILTGGDGADVITGGLGTDRIVETRDDDMVLTNTSLAIGAEGNDVLSGIENATLTGGTGANLLNASAFTAGAMILGTGGGTDTLRGGSGDDQFLIDASAMIAGTKVTIHVGGGLDNEVKIQGRSGTLTQADLEWFQYESGSAAARTTFEAPWYDPYLTVGENIIAPGQDITIKATHITLNGFTIDTSHATKAGSITMSGKHITIDGGAQLIAKATTVGGTDGSITIRAVDDRPYVTGLGFANVDIMSTDVTIGNATIRGGAVTVQAIADTRHYLKDSDFGTSPISSYLASGFNAAIGVIDKFSVLAAVSVSNASTRVDLGAASVIEAGTLLVNASSLIKLSASPTIAPGLGVAVGVGTTSAKVNVAGRITTTGDATIRSLADHTIDQVSDSSAMGGAAAAVAVTVLNSNSTVSVVDTADLTIGRDLSLQADTVDRNRTMARSVAGTDGKIGLSFAISVENGSTNAYLDGKASVARNVAVTAMQKADSIEASKLFIIPADGGGVSAEAGVGTNSKGDFLDDTKSAAVDKVTNKLKTAIKDKINALLKRTPDNTPGTFDVAAAVAVSVDINNTTARIGDGTHVADVTADGNINVTSKIEARPNIVATSEATDESEGDDEKKDQAPAKFGGSLAAAIGVYQNNTSAYIGENSQVDAKGAITVKAESLNELDPFDLWGANLVAPFLNENTQAKYSTQSGEQVLEAGDTVDVKGGHTAGGEVGTRYKYIGPEFSQTDLGTENFGDTSRWESAGNPIKNAATDFIKNLASYANGSFALGADSWSQATAGGQKVALAGAFTVGVMGNKAEALIKSGARINQRATHTGAQTVAVTARSVGDMFSVSGNFETPGVTREGGGDSKKSWKPKFGGPGGGTSNADDGKGAVGATIQVMVFENDTTAKIADGVVLYADSLEVSATKSGITVGLGASGGKANGVAFNGAFFVNVITNNTLAQIDNGATITVGSAHVKDENDVDLGMSVLVQATDTTIAIVGAGALATSNETAIGASVAVNAVTRNTQAVIGNLLGESGGTAGNFTAGGDVKIAAGNKGFIGSMAVAASKTAKNPPPAPDAKTGMKDSSGNSTDDPGKLPNNQKNYNNVIAQLQGKTSQPSGPDANTTASQQGKAGIGISGAVTINIVQDNARAYARQPGAMLLTNSGKLLLDAQNPTAVASLAGAVAISISQDGKPATGIAGALGLNVVSGTTEAFLDGAASITAAGLAVNAERKGNIVSLTAGVAGATGSKGVAVGGSVAVTVTTYTVEAGLRNTTGTIGGAVSVNAQDDTNIILVSGAGGFGGKTGIGAAVAFTYLGNTIRSTVDTVANFSHTGALDVTAKSTGLIVDVSGSAGVGKDAVGGAGTISVNLLENTIEAKVLNSSTLAGSGAVSVTATDSSFVFSIAGAVGVGKNAGFGAAVGVNDIHNTVRAVVEGSTLRSAGTVTLRAKTDSKIVGIALGVGVTQGSADGFALAGSAGANLIVNTVDAHVSGNSTIQADGAITIEAADQSLLIALGGGVAASISGKAGVGAAISYNRVSNGVAAYIDNSVVTSVNNKLSLLANSQAVLVAVAAAGGGGKDAGGAGTISINSIANTVDAHISASTVTVAGDVSVVASEASTMVVLALAGAGATSGSAIGAALAYNYVGGSISIADPNVISYNDGAVEGTKNATVTGTDSATPSNVTAYIDGTGVNAGGNVSVLAGFDDPSKLANPGPLAGAVKTVNTATGVSLTRDTISFGSAHGFNTGDAVYYRNGGGTSIGGLVDDNATKYYIIKVDGNRIKLAASVDDAIGNRAIALTSTGTGTGHTVVPVAQPITIDPAATVGNTLSFTAAHGLNTGDEVLYHNGGGASIGGLADDYTTKYYVIKVGANSVKLATSQVNALAGTAIALTSSGTGSGHNLVLTAAPVTLNAEQTVGNTIAFSGAHGLNTGDAVLYHNGGGASIGGLTDDYATRYYVIKVGTGTLKLAATRDDALNNNAIALTGAGSGSGHSLVLAAAENNFNPAASAGSTIVFAATHNFSTGDEVLYHNGGGASIGGLIDDSTTKYYVINVGANSVKLATSKANAEAGTAIGLTSVGSGTSHNLISTVDGATAVSFNPQSGVRSAISFGVAHGLNTGDAVQYRSGGGASVGGLTDGTLYYAIRVDESTVRLATTSANAQAGTALTLTSAGTGSAHSLVFTAQEVDFNAAESAGNIISFASAHGLATGDEVFYHNGGGASIGGLVDDSLTKYYVIKVGDNSIRLAATQANARANAAITFTAAGTGSSHSVISTAAGATAISFNPAAAVRNSIGFAYAHGLNTGDAIVYKKGVAANSALGGLADNTTYYVIKVDNNTVKLASSQANALANTAIGFATAGTGAGHTLNFVPRAVGFNPAAALANTISFGSVHGLATGDEVVYHNGGGVSIGGLADNSRYYAIKLDDNSIRLATTRAAALAGTAVALTSSGSGGAHTIVLTAAASRVRALSGGVDTIGLASVHNFKTGDSVVYHNGGGASIGGIANNATYYVIKVDDYAFKLASSAPNATAGTAIALTGAGSGSAHNFVPTGTAQSFNAGVAAVAVTDPLADSISFGAGVGERMVVSFAAAHGLQTGDEVLYHNGGGTSVGGLADNTKYYAIRVDDNTLRLATTRANAVAGNAMVFTTAGSGSAHSIVQTARATNFDATQALAGTIRFTAAHGYASGDEVLYHNGGGTSITGLVDNGTTRYYVIKVDDNAIRLANSRTNALVGTAIELRSTGAGSSHSVISTAAGAVAKTFDPGVALDRTVGDTIAFTAAHGLATGDAVYYHKGASGNTSVGGLADDSKTVYFVIKAGDNTIKLANSLENAEAGVAIAFTSAGAGAGHNVIKTAAGSTAVAFDPGVSLGNTISFATAHGRNTGDAVVYQRGAASNGAIGGITENATYYVIKVDANTIRLALSQADATAGIAVAFTSAGTGAGHSIVSAVSGASAITFNGATAVGTAHALATGDAVVYHNGGGTSIGGLVDGETYFAVKVDATHAKLAATYADATAANAKIISLTSAATGAGHTLVKKISQVGIAGAMLPLPISISGQIVSVTAAGAGGKNFGGAGAVTLNFIREGVDAHISNALNTRQVLAGGSISVLANDTSQIASGTGSLALQLGGSGAAVNASVGVSDIRNSVLAHVDSAKLVANAGSVKVGAGETARIINVVAGGAVSTGSSSAGAFGGSFAVNTIRNTVAATIGKAAAPGSGASDVSANGSVTVQSADTALIATLAGNVSASFGGKAAVGVAFAVNDINDSSNALIDASSVSSATGDVIVDASFGKPSVLPAILDWQIASMAVSGAGAQSGAGAGSVALNWIRNNVQARITNVGDLRTGADISAAGKLSVTASDNSTISALAGAITIAGIGSQGVSGAVGASVAYNYLGGDPANPATTTNNVVRAAIENVTGSIEASQVVVSSTYNGRINNITVAGAGSTGQSVTFALGGAVSINRIRNTTDAHVSGVSDLKTTGTLADSVKVSAEDNSSIWVLGGGVGISVGTQGGAALAAGVSVAANEITNATMAYIDDAKVASAGGVDVSAKSTSSIAAMTFGVAVAVSTGSGGFGGSGAGAGSGNTVNNTISGSIRNSRLGGKGVTAGGGRAVAVTATDNSNIVAVAGSLSFGGAFGSGGGAAGSVGISLAINSITDTTSAYIDSANVSTTGNNVTVTATEQSSITAVTIGGSGAGAGGSGGGGALAGAGAGSGNTIKNKALAYIANGSTVGVAGGTSAVKLAANDVSVITAIAGGIAVAGAGGAGGGAAGSLGAAAANNNIENQVKAYIDSSTVNSVASLELTAQETGVITAVSIGAAVAGAGGAGGGFGATASGSGSGNTVKNTVAAYVAGTTSASSVSSSSGAVKLTATDATAITAVSGSLSVSGAGGAGGGAAGAVGVSASNNDIANTVSACIDHSAATAAAGQNVELNATETAVIAAMSIGGSVAGAGGAGGGAAVAAAGAGSGNKTANKVLAYIANGSTVSTTAGGAVKLTAVDASVISAIAGGLGVAGAGGAGGGGAGSLGGAASNNDIANEVKAYIDSSTVTSAATLEITASEVGAISAISIGAAVAGAGGAGGGFAASAAGSGSGSVVANTVAAYIAGSTGASNVSSTAGAVKLAATDATVIVSISGSLAGAGAGGAGGGAAGAIGVSAATTNVGNTVKAYIDHATVTAAAGQNVELTANEVSVIMAISIGGAVAGAGGAGGGAAVAAAGAGTANAVKNKTSAYIANGSSVSTTGGGAVRLLASDVSVISSIAGGLAGAGAGGAGGGGAGSLGAAGSSNTIENQVKAYIDSSTVTSSATLELTAQEIGVIGSFSIGAAVAGAGGAGGGFAASGAGSGSTNNVRNTVAAYISGSTAASNASSTSGAVKLTATDATTILAVAGSLAISGAGGAGGGGAVAVGASTANSDVANTVSAYVDHANVTAAAGQNVEFSATETAVVATMSIGGAFGGSGGAGGGVTAMAAGAGSGNKIANKVYAYIANGSTVNTSGSGSVKLTATDSSVISTIAGGLAAGGAGGAGGGAAGSVGAAAATSDIQNEVKAYIDASTVVSGGNLQITAQETGVIATLSIGAAVAGAGGAGGGFAASAAGSGSVNKVKNTVAAYIAGTTALGNVSSTGGAIQLTATDATVIAAAAGSLAIAGSGGAGGGIAAAVGMSAATSTIENTVKAYIDHASVTAAAGKNVELTANETASITTVTLGGSFGGSGGAGGGVTLLGAGAASDNIVRNKVYAYIANGSTVTTSNGGGVDGAVKLTANDTSVTSAIAGGLAAGGAGGAGGGAAGSMGSAASTNSVQNEVKAYIDASTVSAAGAVEVTAHETGVIASLSIGAAVAGAGGAGGGFAASASGSGSGNTVKNTVAAYIAGSTALSNVSSSNGAIKLTATDATYIAAVAGSLSIAGSGGAGGGISGAVGISAATSSIENTVSAYVDHANVTGAAGKNIELSATESANIHALTLGGSFAGSGGAGGGVSLAAAGAGSANTIGNKVSAYVANGSTVTASGAGAIKLGASDTSVTLAVAGGLAGSGAGGAGGGAAGSLGAAASTNNVHNEVKAYIDASRVLSATGNIELTATEGGYLTATSLGAAVAAAGGAGGGFGGSGAGSGSGNTVGNTVAAYISNSIGTGKGVSTGGGAVKLTANDSTTINAVAGALAFAGAGGAGGGAAVAIGVAAATNNITNSVSAYVDNSSVSAATQNIELAANETASIGATTIGGTLAGSGGAGGGVSVAAAGAGSGNTIANTVRAFIGNNSVVSTTGGGAVKATATDSSSIKALAGSLALAVAGGGGGAGSGSLGASVAINSIANQVKAYVDNATVTSSGAVELSANETATINALAIGGALAVAGAGGGAGAAAGAGADSRNIITNTVLAYVASSSGAKGVTATGGALKLTATDNSHITSDGGGAAAAVGVGGGGGVGVSVGYSVSINSVTNTVRAYADASRLNATNSNIEIGANSTTTIDALNVGAALAVGAVRSGFRRPARAAIRPTRCATRWRRMPPMAPR